MSWKDLKPENPSNPHDSFGLAHNEALDFVLTGFLQLPIRNDSVGAMPLHLSKMISDFLYRESNKKDIVEYEEILNSCYAAMGRCLSNRDANALITARSGAVFFSYYIDLLKVFPYATLSNVADKIDAVKALEATIDGSAMTADEKRIAYWISSVGRYSLAYWMNEFRLEKSLWVSTSAHIGGWEDLPVKLSGGPPKWVVDDIEGAVLSAFFTGNPFTALGGGVLASAFYALKDHGTSVGWW